MKSQRLYLKKLSTNSEREDVWSTPDPKDLASPGVANIISSVVTEAGGQTYHRILLDLDVEHHYVQSSTNGHGHLYINKILTHDEYRELLMVLKKYGILGVGTANQIDRDGMTSLRLPGLQKGINDGDEGY